MLELEQALARVLAAVPAPAGEAVPLSESLGRVVLADIPSPRDLPLFDNSAMDGFAVRAADVASAGMEAPVKLRVIGRAAAGENFTGEISPGTCVRLFTGSPLPKGADAVVMQEDTKPGATHSDDLLVLDKVEPRENIRFRGEDVPQGARLLTAGQRLNFAQLSLLSAVGVEHIEAARRPRIAVLATGSELREPGVRLALGQIYESNRVALDALIRQAGGVPILLPLVADTLAGTRDSLTDALSRYDAVVTSGGASVGEMDFVKQAIQEAGGKLEFWKVSIKPGRPFVFGSNGDKLLFGLPGNPVSALVTFLLLVRPALLRWQGAADIALPTHPGVLTEAISNRGNRQHFMRVRIDSEGKVHSAGLQASHALRSLALANGLLPVGPETVLPAGAAVRVMRWD